jgi:MoxR-like ATPase
MSDRMSTDVQELVAEIERNMTSVVLGKPHVVRLCIVALLAGEHVLLEDVPGVGKTLIAKALAKSVAGSFCRIQFTPDLLPSDILGGNIFNSRTGEFVYSAGPIFANIVLADEINRSSPRTQSALLEAMSDRQVSTDGVTHPLPKPFMVIATQNPFEFEGTYPLPESQLDRFLLRTKIGYPDREDERRVLTSHQHGEPVDELTPVLDCEQVLLLQRATREVRIDDAIHDFLLDIAAATRNSDELLAGVSTRATLALARACQALALIEGRDFVTPDDVKRLAVPVLAHRVIPKGFMHSGSSETAEKQIERMVDEVPVPS